MTKQRTTKQAHEEIAICLRYPAEDEPEGTQEAWRKATLIAWETLVANPTGSADLTIAALREAGLDAQANHLADNDAWISDLGELW